MVANAVQQRYRDVVALAHLNLVLVFDCTPNSEEGTSRLHTIGDNTSAIQLHHFEDGDEGECFGLHERQEWTQASGLVSYEVLALLFLHHKSVRTSRQLSLSSDNVHNLGFQADSKLLVPVPHPSLKVCTSKTHIHVAQTYLIKEFGLVLEPLHSDIIDRRFEQLLASHDILGKNTTSEGNLCQACVGCPN